MARSNWQGRLGVLSAADESKQLCSIALGTRQNRFWYILMHAGNTGRLELRVKDTVSGKLVAWSAVTALVQLGRSRAASTRPLCERWIRGRAGHAHLNIGVIEPTLISGTAVDPAQSKERDESVRSDNRQFKAVAIGGQPAGKLHYYVPKQ